MVHVSSSNPVVHRSSAQPVRPASSLQLVSEAINSNVRGEEETDSGVNSSGLVVELEDYSIWWTGKGRGQKGAPVSHLAVFWTHSLSLITDFHVSCFYPDQLGGKFGAVP